MLQFADLPGKSDAGGVAVAGLRDRAWAEASPWPWRHGRVMGSGMGPEAIGVRWRLHVSAWRRASATAQSGCAPPLGVADATAGPSCSSGRVAWRRRRRLAARGPFHSAAVLLEPIGAEPPFDSVFARIAIVGIRDTGVAYELAVPVSHYKARDRDRPPPCREGRSPKCRQWIGEEVRLVRLIYAVNVVPIVCGHDLGPVSTSIGALPEQSYIAHASTILR